MCFRGDKKNGCKMNVWNASHKIRTAQISVWWSATTLQAYKRASLIMPLFSSCRGNSEEECLYMWKSKML